MIEARDLIQIDATIIAGILILLTVTSFFEKKVSWKTSVEFEPRTIVAYIIFPFAVSAILILFDSAIPNTPTDAHQVYFHNVEPIFSTISTLIGFFYLIVVVFDLARTKISKTDPGPKKE